MGHTVGRRCHLSSGSLCPAKGWDRALASCSWPRFPHGTALCPDATSDPQGAAGPALGWWQCLGMAVTLVPFSPPKGRRDPPAAGAAQDREGEWVVIWGRAGWSRCSVFIQRFLSGDIYLGRVLDSQWVEDDPSFLLTLCHFSSSSCS